MAEENNTALPSTGSGELRYTNPTAKKVMKWVNFVLQLCRLLKSILNRVFRWIDKWEASIESHNTPANS